MGERWSWTGWLAGISCLLAVPSAIADSLNLLHKALPPPLAVACRALTYLLLFASAAALTVRWWRQRAAFAFSGILVRSKRIAHLDQLQARLEAPYYVKRLRLDPLLLGLSVREFAERAQLSWLTSWAILKNPLVIPRPELWPRIEKALLLPEGFFQRGSASDGRKYGDHHVNARLAWYLDVDRRRCQVHLAIPELQSMKYAQRANLLGQIEHKLERDLALEGSRRRVGASQP